MKRMKKPVIITLIVIIITCIISFTVLATKTFIDKKYGSTFYDDFSGDSLDTSKWLIAQKAWGGNNGGVVPQNVSVSNGTLKLEGHGNYYKGDIAGINRPDGTRTGAAIATREYFSSGTYEVVAKVAPEFGACSAIWTFEYEEYYPGEPEYEAAGATGSYYEVNHEIDIEMPGRPSSNAEPSFNYALCNTFVRENTQTTNFTELANAQNDGNWHTYRFDWHTGDKNEIPRVDYFVDGVLVKTCTTNIPTNAGRFWIGIWFPCSADLDKDGICETGWAGTANFDTAIFEIDSVKITPLHEDGDTEQNETYPKDGWAPGSFPEDTENPDEKEDNEDNDNKPENTENENTNTNNLVVNGDFSKGSEHWEISGGTTFEDEKAVLQSGSDTDTLSQKIKVKKSTTYILTADVVTDGTEVTIGVNDYDGRYTKKTKTLNKNGKVTIEFTTANHIDLISVFAEVLRYQDKDNKVYVDNICLVEKNNNIQTEDKDDHNQGNTTSGSTTGNTTGNTTDSTAGDNKNDNDDDNKNSGQKIVNLVKNGEFKNSSNWKLIGSPKIKNGKAILSSGLDTDIIEQKITVKPNTKYKLTADISSSGAEVDLAVSGHNGKYSETKSSYTSNAKGVLEFKTGSLVDDFKVFIHVLRYQENNEDVTIDNVVLQEVK